MRLELKGFWYGEAYGTAANPGYCTSPMSGAWVRTTEHGDVQTEYPLLFTRGRPGKVAGQAQPGSGAPVGNIEVIGSGIPRVVGTFSATNPVLYRRTGELVQAVPSDGVNGIRYEAENGAIITGDATYRSPDGLLAEYTQLGGIRAGQAVADESAYWGALVQLNPSKPERRVLEAGACYSIRMNFDAPSDSFAFGIRKAPDLFVALWMTRAELAQLPVYVDPDNGGDGGDGGGGNVAYPDPAQVKVAISTELAKYGSAIMTSDQMVSVLNNVALKFPGCGMHKYGGTGGNVPGTNIHVSRQVLRYLPAGDNYGVWADVLGQTGTGHPVAVAPDWKPSSDDKTSFVPPVGTSGGGGGGGSTTLTEDDVRRIAREEINKARIVA